MQQRHFVTLVALGWTCAVALSGVLSFARDYADLHEDLRGIARIALEKDMGFRRWNALHGGVYVLVDKANRPNPYLDVPDRDLRTTGGQVLTLVNPAYMMRQVNELDWSSQGIKGHITSLRPTRPGNVPDDWERVALLGFERGAAEVSSRESIGGEEHMRIMRPFSTDTACLKCHAKQGYKEGDIRGGISVTVPIKAQLADFRLHAGKDIVGHTMIWALGLSGVILGGRRLGKSLRETEQARAAAEAASQAKSEFMANMSHEIRTPLNGLLGMLHLLKNSCTSQEQASQVDMAFDSGRRLLTLLNDILEFSRMESGPLVLHHQPFSLRETFGSLAQLYQPACAHKGLALCFLVDESVPEQFVGDEGRVRQVLFNLVGNALKFTAAGQVAVSAWARPLASQPGRFRLYLEVLDTGVGIPDDKLPHIFDHFTQADGSQSRCFEGAGLGLSIVRRIVECMGGGIVVDSEPGEGTTFCVHLLLDTRPSGLPSGQPSGQQAPGLDA